MCLFALLIATVLSIYVDSPTESKETANYDSLIVDNIKLDNAIIVDSLPFNPNALVLDSLSAVNTLDSLNLASEVIGYKLRVSIEKASKNLKRIEKLNAQLDTIR